MRKELFDAGILNNAQQAQQQALQPAPALWIGAHAGTGKTHLLVHKLVVLLLRDDAVAPSQVLALTFTRAAAAELASRLRGQLMKLSLMGESEITVWLQEHTLADMPLDAVRQRVQSILQAPQGVQCKTLDSFCQQLVQQFPIECGLTPGVEVVEEVDASALRQQALHNVLTSDDDVLVAARETLLEHTAPTTLQNMVATAAQQVPLQLLAGVNLAQLAGWLGLDEAAANEPLPQWWQQQQAQILPQVQWAAAHWRKSTKANQSGLIGDVTEAAGRGELNWARLVGLVVNVKAGVAHPPEKPFKKDDLTDIDDEVLVRLEQLHEQVFTVFEEHNKRRLLEQTWALLLLSARTVAAYDQLKRQYGVVDFADLSTFAVKLLRDPAQRDWVRYKLEQRLRHVLVDEAQDTSPAQWAVVQALVEEFAYSEHSSSLTIVGDVKQSIYAFRQAEPRLFVEDMRKQVDALGGQVVRLATSFRSSSVITTLANQLLAQPGVQQQLGEPEAVPHQAVAANCGGQVTLWPLVQADETEKEEPQSWPLPARQAAKVGVAEKLAQQLVAHVQQLLGSTHVLESTGKAVSAGDIMVLCRGRTGVHNAVVAALQAAGIPVVVDVGQGDGTPTVVVDDLIALVAFLSNPLDDVSLLQCLRSPWGGWQEKDVLEAITPGEPLWLALQEHAHPTVQKLVLLREKVGLVTPQNLLSEAVRVLGVRVSYAQNSAVVQQQVDALLATAGEHQQLTALLDALQQNPPRPPAQSESGGAVRVMTVHQSKGLEAPIVFLPDTANSMGDLRGADKEPLLMRPQGADESWPPLVMRLTKTWAPDCQIEWEQHVQQARTAEELRLLYVALTRAGEQLHIMGVQTKKKVPDNCWYGVLHQVAEDNSWAEQDEKKVLFQPASEVLTPQVEAQQEIPALPAWALENVATAQPKTTREQASSTQVESAEGAAFGDHVHHVLAQLNRAPLAQQQTVLDQSLVTVPAPWRGAVAAQVRAVWQAHAQLFTDQCLAEVPLGGQTSFGVIDLLVVHEAEVWVVDYKTDREPAAEDVEKYTRQLQFYARAVQQLWPNKSVKCALLWTQNATLQWL